MNKMLIPLIALAMGGCASMTPKEVVQTQTLVIAKCPVLKEYSKEKLKIAADELRNLASDSELAVMLADYSKLRDACRIVKKELKKN